MCTRPTGFCFSTTNSAVIDDALMSSSAADTSIVGEIVFGFAVVDLIDIGLEQIGAHVDGASRRL